MLTLWLLYSSSPSPSRSSKEIYGIYEQNPYVVLIWCHRSFFQIFTHSFIHLFVQLLWITIQTIRSWVLQILLYQGSKRAAQPSRPTRPNKICLSGRAGRSTKTDGPGGPSFLSGRPGPIFLFFLLFIKLYDSPKRQKLSEELNGRKTKCIIIQLV